MVTLHRFKSKGSIVPSVVLAQNIEEKGWSECVLGRWVTMDSRNNSIQALVAKHLSSLSRSRSCLLEYLLLVQVYFDPLKPKPTSLHWFKQCQIFFLMSVFRLFPPNLSLAFRISLKSPPQLANNPYILMLSPLEAPIVYSSQPYNY